MFYPKFFCKNMYFLKNCKRLRDSSPNAYLFDDVYIGNEFTLTDVIFYKFFSPLRFLMMFDNTANHIIIVMIMTTMYIKYDDDNNEVDVIGRYYGKPRFGSVLGFVESSYFKL